MTTKRVSFDLMNLGKPVNTDPFDFERLQTQESVVTGMYPQFFLPDNLLRTKLAEEAKNLNTDFLVRDPSSSDESDDYAFPETINEQVRRLSFAKRRTQHYTEFATVDLARRLVCAEFASATSSVKSEDSDFRSQEIEEECSPCWPQSAESLPFIQYDPPNDASQGSDESALKEELEPGFDPSHHCYHKLVGELSSPIPTKQDRTPATEQPSDAAINPIITPSVMSMADVNKDLQESLERHTRVQDKGGKWDLQQSHPNPLFPAMERESKPKVSRPSDSVRSEQKPGKPVGFRSV